MYSVIRWQNDMVMVFDIFGEQIPEYQGSYSEVKEKILRDAPPVANFYHGRYGRLVDDTKLVERDQW
jgi:hypothetical protein